MEYRQHSAVDSRIYEFVDMPGSCSRPGFSLSITDKTGNYKVRIVENCTVRSAQGISQLSAFQNYPGGSGVAVAWKAVGPAEFFA